MNFNNGYKLLLKIDNNMNLCLNLSSNKNSLVDEIIITKIEDNEWYNLCINMNFLTRIILYQEFMLYQNYLVIK